MYLVLLTLTLLATLSVARRIAEPACPACGGKQWTEHPPLLSCRSCGWATGAAPVLARVELPTRAEAVAEL